jgi:hypothetical protein
LSRFQVEEIDEFSDELDDATFLHFLTIGFCHLHTQELDELLPLSLYCLAHLSCGLCRAVFGFEICLLLLCSKLDIGFN